MSINGIPVLLKGPDGKVERPVFASTRKHPALLGLMKAINKADMQESASARRVMEARRKMDDCPIEELTQATDYATQAASNRDDASAAVLDAIHDFLVAGFSGAGYTSDEAERLASLIPPERLQELKAKCLLGCGVADFSNAS